MKTPKATRRKKVTIELIVPMHIWCEDDGYVDELFRMAIEDSLNEVPKDAYSFTKFGTYKIIRGEARLNE